MPNRLKRELAILSVNAAKELVNIKFADMTKKNATTRILFVSNLILLTMFLLAVEQAYFQLGEKYKAYDKITELTKQVNFEHQRLEIYKKTELFYEKRAREFEYAQRNSDKGDQDGQTD